MLLGVSDSMLTVSSSSSSSDITVKTEESIKQEPSPWGKIKKEILDMSQKWRDLQKLAEQGKSTEEIYVLSLKCKRDISKCLRHISRAKNGEPITRKRKADKEDEEDEKEFGKFSTSSYAQAPTTKKRKSSSLQQQQQIQQVKVEDSLLTGAGAGVSAAGAGGPTVMARGPYAGIQEMYTTYQHQVQQQQQQQMHAMVKESPVGGGLKNGRRVFVYSNNDKNYILAKVSSYDKSLKSYMVIDADNAKNSFVVSENYVTPLPKGGNLNLEPGTRVMALYNPSTCFYPGVVTLKAQPNVKKEYFNIILFLLIFKFNNYLIYNRITFLAR